MSHCHDDVIALASLGEPVSPADAAHLSSCLNCGADVERLRRVVGAVRVDLVPGPAIAPPARVWEAIAAQISDAAQPGVAQPAPAQPGSARVGPGSVLSIGGAAGRRRPPGRRSRRIPWPVLAVAAAALVVGAAGGSVVTSLLGGRATTQSAPVVAQTALTGLALAPQASGTAVIVSTSSGPRLDVDVARLGAEPGHFYEVWLIDRKIQKMVAVGVLSGTTGQFVIPSGLDLREYPIVDISLQLPGDPRHSGRSVLRGTVDA